MPLDNIHNEQELLLKIAEGDEQAFQVVCNYYSPLLYTTIYRFTNEQWMADEIVQDVFLKMWLKKAEIPKIENFRGWLYTVASNLTINALKKNRREKNNANHWVRFSFYDVESVDAFSKENEVNWEILTRAINRLPPKQRDTFRLIKEKNMKRGDVAKILQVSPETVKWNLEQALRNIRAYCMAKMDGLFFFLVLWLIN